MRRLQVTRRQVALDVLDEYVAAWQEVRAAVEAVGGHAWMFRGAAHQDQFLEFIEWRSGASPAEHERVSAVSSQLDALAASHSSDQWEELT